MDKFIFGAYWGSRAETMYEVADKILYTLEGLVEQDDQFLKWYQPGISRKKALEKVVFVRKEEIIELLKKNTLKKEINEEGYSEFGFHISLWTGHEDYFSASLSFGVGHSFNNPNLGNRLVLTIPSKGHSRERLLKFEKAKSIVELFAEIWHPDYAVLTSEMLRDIMGVGNKIGWITYTKFIKQIQQSSKFFMCETKDGCWIYLNPENYGYGVNAANKLIDVKSNLLP
jgi:hypothetical protein